MAWGVVPAVIAPDALTICDRIALFCELVTFPHVAVAANPVAYAGTDPSITGADSVPVYAAASKSGKPEAAENVTVTVTVEPTVKPVHVQDVYSPVPAYHVTGVARDELQLPELTATVAVLAGENHAMPTCMDWFASMVFAVVHASDVGEPNETLSHPYPAAAAETTFVDDVVWWKLRDPTVYCAPIRGRREITNMLARNRFIVRSRSTWSMILE